MFNNKLCIALTIYISALLASNTLGMKTMPFLFGTHLSTAIFFFPFVFLMTDVVGEVYGKKCSRFFVRMGLLATILQLGFTFVSNSVPASSHFGFLASYNDVFGLSLRFTIASLVAFIIGEYQDVFSFFYLKEKLAGRFFVLRSFISNLWGQFLDTAIWMAIAFTGVYSFKVVVLMALPWWIFKVIMGLLYSPISIIGVKLLKHDNQSN